MPKPSAQGLGLRTYIHIYPYSCNNKGLNRPPGLAPAIPPAPTGVNVPPIQLTLSFSSVSLIRVCEQRSPSLVHMVDQSLGAFACRYFGPASIRRSLAGVILRARRQEELYVSARRDVHPDFDLPFSDVRATRSPGTVVQRPRSPLRDARTAPRHPPSAALYPLPPFHKPASSSKMHANLDRKNGHDAVISHCRGFNTRTKCNSEWDQKQNNWSASVVYPNAAASSSKMANRNADRNHFGDDALHHRRKAESRPVKVQNASDVNTWGVPTSFASFISPPPLITNFSPSHPTLNVEHLSLETYLAYYNGILEQFGLCFPDKDHNSLISVVLGRFGTELCCKWYCSNNTTCGKARSEGQGQTLSILLGLVLAQAHSEAESTEHNGYQRVVIFVWEAQSKLLQNPVVVGQIGFQ
ncbi:hypothetical protein K438DRAFT_1756722 [Mycena galopus ATCC 62051]|nr:hypothetical protein K438DRAFT_1756722 [Mycena galopus ATCC 62051]